MSESRAAQSLELQTLIKRAEKVAFTTEDAGATSVIRELVREIKTAEWKRT